MGLFFENSSPLRPEEIISFNDALTGFKLICDNDLVKLIKRHSIELFDYIKPIQNPETGDVEIYCEKVDIGRLNHEYEIKTKYIKTDSIDFLVEKYPKLRWTKPEHINFGQLKAEIANRDSQIDRYSAKIKELENDLEECRGKFKTLNATAGRSENTATRWASYIKTAVFLAVYCMKEKKKYTIDELNKICSDNQQDIMPREALVAFRKAMPKELIKEQGAPSKK